MQKLNENIYKIFIIKFFKITLIFVFSIIYSLVFILNILTEFEFFRDIDVEYYFSNLFIFN